VIGGPPAIFCPACGTAISTPSRKCPSCHELLPAPPTVPGFAELPAALPAELQVPDTKRSQPPLDNAPVAAWQAAVQGQPPPGIQPAAESIQVSRMANSYPNKDMPSPAPPVVQLPGPPAPALVAPAPSAPAAPAPDSYGPAPVPGDSTAEQAPIAYAFGVAPPPPPVTREDPMAFMQTLPAQAKKPAARSMSPVGGLLLGGGILMLTASLLLIAFHGSILSDFGYYNAEASVQAAAWVSFFSAVPALLVMLAGAASLTRSMAPRALCAVALATHTLWSAAAVSVLATLFPVDGLAVECIAATAASWVVIAALAIAAIASAREPKPAA
jgi:hypothetical protein